MTRTRKVARLHILLAALAVSLALFAAFGPLRKPADRDDAIVRRFSQLYHVGREVHQRTFWGGVKIQQTPTDMWAIQEIIVAQRPDFLIETGTLKGGSALFFASVFHAFKDSGRVITVNIEKQIDPEVEAFPIFREHVVQIIGDAAAPETIARIAAIVQGHPALVMLDDLHTWEHVLAELPLYAPFVGPGGYLIVNDTNFGVYSPDTRFPDGGPLHAVEAFLETHPEFISDRGPEKFLLTFYPRGYLKRIR